MTCWTLLKSRTFPDFVDRRFRAGGPLKPSFGLSGDFQLLHGAVPPPARVSLPSRLEGTREGQPLQFAHQKMNVRWHDHIPVDEQPRAAPNPLQSKFKDALGQSLDEQGPAMVTAEGHKVSLPGLLEPL